MKPKLVTLCSLLCLAIGVGAQQPLYSTEIQSLPDKVSAKDTQLSLSVQPKSSIPLGGVVELKIPDGVSFTADAIAIVPLCEFQGEGTPEIVDCRIEPDGNSITWMLPRAMPSFSSFEVAVQKGFNNPISTEPTRTFEMRIFSDSSKTSRLDYQDVDLQMRAQVEEFDPDESILYPVGMFFGGTGEVSKPTKVELDLTMKIAMPPGAVITMDFPIYNPQAVRSQQKSYFVNPQDTFCFSVDMADENMSCTVEKLTVGGVEIDRLTIVDAMPNGASAGDQYVIEIDSIFNPLSMTTRHFQTSIAVVSKVDGKTYNIQQGLTFYAASLPTTISQVNITALDHTVQEYSQFKIEFHPDVEIEIGAIVVVQFPLQAFSFDNNLNSMTTIGGMFGSRSDNVNFITDSVTNKIETKEGTTRWMDPGVASIIVSKIRNPDHVATTGTFKIFVYDQHKKLIATKTDGLEYDKTESGSIRDVKVTPMSLFIAETDRLSFEFVPLHDMPQDAQIKLQFTKDIEITCPDAQDALTFGYNSKQLSKPLNMTCTEATEEDNFTTILLLNPLQASYVHEDRTAVKAGRYDATKIIKVVFSQTTNALSAREIRGIKIETMTKEGQLIDTYEDAGLLFTLKAKPINGVAISTATDETYTANIFTFSLTLANKLLPGSYVEIALPAEVKLQEGLIPQLVAGSNVDPVHSAVQVNVDTFGQVVIKVYNFITETMGQVSINDQVSFGLESLITPLSTLSSSSFKIYTKDIKGRLVNYVENDLFVTMRKGKNISTFKVAVANSTVGATTDHLVAFDTAVPLKPSYTLVLVYPDQPRPPVGSKVVCKGGASLAESLSCEVLQDIVTITDLQFRGQGMTDELDVGSKVSFSIAGGLNPVNARPTEAFKLYIKNLEGNVVSEISNPDFEEAKLSMSTPALISEYEFGATDERQLAKTAFSLSFTTTQPYPKDAYLMVKLDPDVLGPEVTDGVTSVVECFSNLQLQVKCAFEDSSTLRVDGVVIDQLRANTHISVQFTNFEIFVVEPSITQSWQVMIYTPDGFFIEGRSEGFNLQFECSVPCLTCKQGQPDQCTSCNSLTGLNILYQQQCLDRCPATTFYEDSSYGCKKCNSNCLTCAYTNGNECTSCDPNSLFPYLDGTVCKSECPFGTYEDGVTNQCEPCQSPCQSCNTGPLDCNTCDIKSTQPFLQEERCLTSCEPGWAVPSDNLDFVCQPCNSNCETCIGELDFCLSCKPDGAHLLSKLDNTCENTCPADLTIESVTTDQTPVCLTCTGKCKTCQGSTDFCSSCTPGFILDQEAGSCVKECSDDSTRVEKSGQCVDCQFPCATCEGEPDYCLSCEEGLLMHDYACIEQCPDQYEAREDGRCVLTGFFCRFGYEMNAAGDACFLKAQICEGYDILNYDKTKCIPMPGILIPFPLTFLACIGGLVILVAKMKHPNTRFYPSMICMLSVLESIGLFCLVALSSEYGIRPAYSLSGCALAFLFGINMFAALVYFKQIKRDIVFKYWEQEFPLTSLFIVCTSFFFNFKVYRAFYTRFGDRKDLNAVFQDQSIFYRSVIFGSALYLLTGTLPIVVASCFGIWYIPFGYQVQMFCLEMIVIEALLLLCMGLELFKISKHILSKQYQKVRSDKLGMPYRIVPINEGANSFYTDSEESTLLRKLLQKISVKDAGKREYTTVAEIRELHEQEFRRRQLRRCFSFREARDFLDERDPMQALLDESDSEDAEDEKRFNYISEPSSPRSKEMLLNPNFHCRMNELSKAYSMRDQYDNCYHEARPLYTFDYKSTVMVERTVQTNVLELLGVDDLLPQDSGLRSKLDRLEPETVKMGEQSVHEESDLDEAAEGFGQDLVGKVLGNFEGFQQHKKRKRLPPARMRNLPKFGINDIIGEFDIDEDGNFIIVSNGYDDDDVIILEDSNGRRVNRRGYLLNEKGHVITKDGFLVFRPDEIDSDDEIPAPFCYQKHKDTLGLKSDAPPNLYGIVLEQDEEDEMIDREFRKMNQGQKNHPQLTEDSVEDPGAAPSQLVGQDYKPRQKLDNPNNDDLFERIVQPMRPKARDEIVPARKDSGEFGTQNQDLNVSSNNHEVSAEEREPLHLEEEPGHKDTALTQASPPRARNPSGLERLEEFNVELAARPVSGVYGGQHAMAKKERERRSRKTVKDTSPIPAYKRDTEQEILEGIEKFQAMLARYPVRPKSSRASNSLANKKLNRVYGKIRQQFTRNLQIDNNPKAEISFPTLQSPLASRSSNPFQNHRSSENSVNHPASTITAIKQNEKMKNLQELYSGSRSFKTNKSQIGGRKVSANSASQKNFSRKDPGHNLNKQSSGGSFYNQAEIKEHLEEEI